ncbi:carbohydrate ABC transporter permease [Paenibacillus psychroresistens]|uniref:Carbohydrate ABC transporter permease n=1 Tax=Paenibacillus psychroresistens TaxID=1778678 RepID=A0A6B8REY5_9BACL|nr:carbohydrate ABC transporter permease [Paenibacillus psychroresistens]QGQ94284.1 carbohydrate ABC transporter permease [Paenibacillus psychroresistens]
MQTRTFKLDSDKLFDIINIGLLIVITLIFLYPLLFVVSASISDPLKVTNGEVWLWPKGFSLEAYKTVFANKDILIGYKNTIIYTVVGTAVNLCMTIAAAYPLSRKDFYGRTPLTILFTFTMFFSGGLIPTYIVIGKLGLLNHFWVMILPNAVSMFNVYLMRTYFQSSIPEELHEAATIDGARKLTTLFRIVLPLSAPIIAVMILFYAVEYWNSYFNALIYLSDRAKFTLQLFLREILVQNQTASMIQPGQNFALKQALLAQSIKYALIIIANLPVLMLYPFAQRYFVQGVMIGAIKG